jgi:hypothetical protein
MWSILEVLNSDEDKRLGGWEIELDIILPIKPGKIKFRFSQTPQIRSQP